MRIEITKDFRCFKEGTVYNLDFQPGEITFIVGPNGCGKSTLMFALRCYKDTLKDLNNKRTEGMRELSLMTHFLDTKAHTKIEGYDFELAFHKDTVVDNPTSFMNAATAYGLISGGGLANQTKSCGQGQLNQMLRFWTDVVQACGPKSDERILIVMDELDDGLDLRSQVRMAFIMNKMLLENYPNASIVVVTHSIVTAMGASQFPEIKSRVFDVKRNQYTTASKFFTDETDFYLMMGHPKETEEEKEQEVNLDELKGVMV